MILLKMEGKKKKEKKKRKGFNIYDEETSVRRNPCGCSALCFYFHAFLLLRQRNTKDNKWR